MQDRHDLAKKGHALPDGSFPIADVEDLKSAIRNWALGKHPEVAKKHIIARARALGAISVIPDKWLDQSVAHASDEEVADFLAHFGVKGMKWGVVHDVDSTGHAVAGSRDLDKAKVVQAKRDAKAGKYEEQAKQYDAQITQVKAQTPRSAIGRRAQASSVRELEGYRDQALKDAEAKRQGKLTDTQKKVAIGAAVVGAVVIGAVVYSGVQSGEFNRLAAKGQALVKGQPLDFKKNPKFSEFKDPDSVFENVVKGINPNYGAPGTKVNCRRATFAYELRRRGYDVRATRTTGGTGQNSTGLFNALTEGKTHSTSKVSIIARSLKNPSEDDKVINYLASNNGRMKIPGTQLGKREIVSPKSIFDTLSSQPDGSRGELSVHWLGGGGHSLAYEIFNGKPVVFDTQSGDKYDSLEALNQGVGSVARAGFSRLDTMYMNKDFLSKWVTNA
jgi:hypothetical protein